MYGAKYVAQIFLIPLFVFMTISSTMAELSNEAQNFEKQKVFKEWPVKNVALVIFKDGNLLALESRNQTIKVWNARNEESNPISSAHKQPITYRAFSADGYLLALGSEDGSIELWDVSKGTKIETLGKRSFIARTWGFLTFNVFSGKPDAVTSLAFSLNGKWLVSGYDNGAIKLWDVGRGYKKTDLGKGDSRSRNHLAFGPDERLASEEGEDGTIRLWDVEAPRVEPITLKHGVSLTSLAFSPDGKLASGGQDGTVRLWDTKERRAEDIFQHDGPVACLAFSSDGKLASGSQDGRIIVYDAKNQSTITLSGHTEQVNSVAFNSDGKLLASGSNDAVILWQVTSSAIEIVDAASFPKTITQDTLSLEFNVTNLPKVSFLDQIILYSSKLDGRDVSKSTTQNRIDLDELPDGEHTFQVEVSIDSWKIAPAEVTFTVNASPNATIQSIPEQIQGTDITISYSGKDARTPEEELQYSWRLDGGEWSAFLSKTEVILQGLTGGRHVFEVRARDADSKIDPTPDRVTFEILKQLPTVKIQNAQESEVASSDYTFEFDGSDLQTEKNQLQYSWRVDKGTWSDYSPNQEAKVLLTPLSKGSHLFEVQVKDTDGNTASHVVPFTVAEQSPKIEILSPPTAEVTTSSYTFKFEGRDLQTPTDQLQYSWRLDVGGWSEFSRETSALLKPLDNRNYVFQVRVKDTDDHIASAEVEFTVADQLPEVRILNIPTVKVIGPDYTFEFEGSDLQTPNQLQYSWQLDTEKESGFSTQTSATLPRLSEGPHRFQVRVKDADEHEGTAEAQFTVAKQVPEVTILKPSPNEVTNSINYTVEFRGSDLQTPTEQLGYFWRLDGGNWSGFSSPTSAPLSDLSEGSHQFQVRVKDADEYISPLTEVFFTVAPPIPPDTEILTKFDGPITFNSPPFRYSFEFGSQGGKEPIRYSWRLYGRKWSEYTSTPKALVGDLTKSLDILQVRAMDNNDREDPTPAQLILEVEINPQVPEVSIEKFPDTIRAKNYTFKLKGKDLQNKEKELEYSWRLDRQKDWKSLGNNRSVEIKNLTDGQHTLFAKCKDPHGNISSEAIAIFNVIVDTPIIAGLSWFSLGLEFQGDLDNNNLSEDLRRELESNGVTLSPDAIISTEKEDSDWRITDKNGDEQCTIRKEQGRLSIYTDFIPSFLGTLTKNQLILTLEGQDLQTPAEQLEYSYSLDGKRSDYSKGSTISLDGLKQEDHVLSIKVRDTDGNESKPYEMRFSVDLPFYRLRLFRGAVVVMVLAVIGVLVTMRVWLYRERRDALETRYNPYITGSPVMEESRFFGRKEFLRELKASIHDNSFIIMGDNRIGKTSVLHRLADELKTMRAEKYLYLPLYIDISYISEEDEFFGKLLMATRRQVRQILPELDFGSILKEEDDNYYRFQATIGAILNGFEEKGTGGRQIRLIFMLDECDALNGLGLRAKAKIRSIFMQRYAQNVSSILTGVSIHLDPQRTSPWWNAFKIKLMTPFTDEEVRTLIKEPAGNIYHFEDEAISAILNWSERSPYLVQLLCHEAVNMAINDRRLKITGDDIQTVISHCGKEKKSIGKAPTEEELKQQFDLDVTGE